MQGIIWITFDKRNLGINFRTYPQTKILCWFHWIIPTKMIKMIKLTSNPVTNSEF